MPDNQIQYGQILYGLDDRPAFPRAVVLAAQHVLTMFGSTVVVPLMFGPQLWPIPAEASASVKAELTNLQLTNTALLISSVMLCSGIATVLQSTFGSRLPIIQGVSFSFLAAFTTIIASVQKQNEIDWTAASSDSVSRETLQPLIDAWQETGAAGMQTIAGAILIGALFEIFVGFSGLMGFLRRYLSPVVVGPVIMLIGLALYQFGAPKAATNWPVSIGTIVLISLFALVLSRKVTFLRLFPMLSAIVVMVTYCAILTWTGVYTPDTEGYVDLSAFRHVDWVRTTDLILPWGMPQFTLSATVAVLAGYLASMIESFGDYHACKNIAGAGDPTPEEISRGIGFEGVGCAMTGLLGGFSSTSYSENIGLVGLTKVASRYVVQIGGVILILLGLFGKFGAFAAAIPQPVVGGLYCTMFGLIAAVGVRQFARADLNSDRNLFVGGFALFMGLSVAFYFSQYSTGRQDVAWMAPSIRDVVLAIGESGMAVAAILGILLDNMVPGTREERGLAEGPGVLVPEGGDVDVE